MSIFDSLEAQAGAAIRMHINSAQAIELLEANKDNRPLRQQHINRIAKAITDGRWRFNGDTIKISKSRDILDGQHRLWAVSMVEGASIDTLIVLHLDREVFETIDTIRVPRTFGDTIALEGQKRYLAHIGTALTWLLRYDKQAIETYRDPKHRVENHDIKLAFRANPNIVSSVAAVAPLRQVHNVGILAFFHYVLSRENGVIAEKFLQVLCDPASTPVDHPFYRLRYYLVGLRGSREVPNPVRTIALMIKASNAAYEGRELRSELKWVAEGANRDRFPILAVRNLRKQQAGT